MSDKIVKIEELKALVSKKLETNGIIKTEADIIADVLVNGDARGVRSHGTIRLEHYVNRIQKGGINLKAKYDFKLTAKSAGIMNADGGMGHIGMYKAMEQGIKVAKETGLCAISVQNTSHCGALSYYVDMALKNGLISMIFVNTDKCVAPFGGSGAFFGTNPIAFGFPGINHRILIDMATSEVAFGKILAARETNTEIPSTWGVDEVGAPTTDPHKVVAVTPMAAYKGTAIATVVEGFVGMFTGAFGPHIVSMYGDLDKFRNTGGFIFVMDPNIFGDGKSYLNNIDKIFEELKAFKPAPGVKSMTVAGEPEELRYQKSLKYGVTIYQNVYDFIKQ